MKHFKTFESFINESYKVDKKDFDKVVAAVKKANQPATVMGTISEYTIGLPGKVIGAMSSKEENSPDLATEGLQPLSDEEYKLQNTVSGIVSIANDKKEGIVSLTVVEGDPVVAAQVAQVTEQILQDWIIEYKIKNAKAQYDFIEKQIKEKKKELVFNFSFLG